MGMFFRLIFLWRWWDPFPLKVMNISRPKKKLYCKVELSQLLAIDFYKKWEIFQCPNWCRCHNWWRSAYTNNEITKPIRVFQLSLRKISKIDDFFICPPNIILYLFRLLVIHFSWVKMHKRWYMVTLTKHLCILPWRNIKYSTWLNNFWSTTCFLGYRVVMHSYLTGRLIDTDSYIIKVQIDW